MCCELQTFAFMKTLCFLAACFLGFTGKLFSQVGENSFAVIELFVSEGCGASPTSEKYIHEMTEGFKKQNKPVMLLTFHVDYWNKYGWKDPYSSFAFTRRQNNYSSALKQKEVFTPQVFINGQVALAGNEIKKIKAETERVLKMSVKDSLKIKVDSTARDTLWISYSATRANPNLTLAVFFVQPEATTAVLKGDNEGKTLTHKNVVRKMDFFPVIRNNGRVAIPIRQLKNRKDLFLVAYLQQKQTKKILALCRPVQPF